LKSYEGTRVHNSYQGKREKVSRKWAINNSNYGSDNLWLLLAAPHNCCLHSVVQVKRPKHP